MGGNRVAEIRRHEAYVEYEGDFERIVRDNEQPLRRLVATIADRNDVDDIVQETLLRAYVGRDRFDSRRPAWPWLATIARRVTIDVARRRQRRPRECAPHDAQLERVAPAEDLDPVEFVERTQQVRTLRTALEALPDRQRRLLVLRDVEGRGYDEIRELEGASLDSLKCAISRARRRLAVAYGALDGSARSLGVIFPCLWRWARVRWAQLRDAATSLAPSPAPELLGQLVGDRAVDTGRRRSSSPSCERR